MNVNQGINDKMIKDRLKKGNLTDDEWLAIFTYRLAEYLGVNRHD